MTAENKYVVLVTSLGLSDDIVSSAVLGNGVDDQGSASLSGGDQVKQSSTGFLGDADSGSVVTCAAEGTSKVSGDVVVDDGSNRAGGFGIGGLLAKRTGTTLDESDGTRNLRREVSCIAADVRGCNQRRSDVSGGRVGLINRQSSATDITERLTMYAAVTGSPLTERLIVAAVNKLTKGCFTTL